MIRIQNQRSLVCHTLKFADVNPNLYAQYLQKRTNIQFLKGIGYEDVVNLQRAKDFFDQKKGLSETIRTRHRVNKPFGTPLHFQVTTPKRWKRRDRNQDRES